MWRQATSPPTTRRRPSWRHRQPPPPSRCTSHPSPLPGRVSGVAARPAQPPLSLPRTLPISDLERWFHRKIGVPCLIHLTWARRFPGAPKSFLLMHSGLRVKRKTAQRAGGCGRQLPERQMGAVAICCAPRAPRTARARAPRRDGIPRRSSHQGVSPWPRLHKERRRGTSSHLPYCAQACFSDAAAPPLYLGLLVAVEDEPPKMLTQVARRHGRQLPPRAAARGEVSGGGGSALSAQPLRAGGPAAGPGRRRRPRRRAVPQGRGRAATAAPAQRLEW